jgi:competence protein ComEA
MDGQKRFIAMILTALILIVSAAPVDAGNSAKINVNTASAQELTELKGVGPKYAARIVAYREKNGPFKTLQDLRQVKGIGPKTIENNQDRIVFKDAKKN